MNLKEIRIKHNMTQHDVAAHLGYTNSVYCRYERGTRQPSVECLIKMADLFGVTLDYLGGEFLEIAEKTGASTATISRVNRSLNYGCDGYDMVFSRLGK